MSPIPRSFRPLALVSTLALGACDCGDGPSLPGPAQSGFTKSDAQSIAALGIVPFDVDQQDLVGPAAHDAKYGKTPEIVVQPGDGFFDAVVRSTDDTAGPRAVLVHVIDAGGTATLDEAFEIPTLGLVLGFVRADDGSFYYATGTNDDDVNAGYPGATQHRSNVVRVYHASASGEILFDVDLDLARKEANEDAAPLVNPGVAASARLGLAGGTLALVTGNNTKPDPSINDTRHQMAMATYLDASSGEISATSGIWVSHSFDQRYLVDGNDLFELHLGDAYPREVVVSRVRTGRAGGSFAAYHPKGDTGANNTFTRLGGIVRIDSGAGAGGYLVLFATERTTTTATNVEGSRDLALVRFVPDFASGDDADAIDDGFGTTFSVSSGGETVENRALFLTDFHDDEPRARHAERPKLVAIGGGQFLVLFEEWTTMDDGTHEEFDGTYAMRIDGAGAISAGPTRISDHHLPRGDDAFPYGDGAAWVTGDRDDRTLTIHRVTSALAITESVVP